MATLLLGAAARHFGFNALWTSVAMMAGSYIDQSLFAPKIEGQRLQDLRIQTSTYGVAIPKAYGEGSRVAGNIIWGTKFVEHKKTSSQGGKGGGAKVTEYSYSVSFAVALSKGPITGISRIWSDGKPFPLYESKFAMYGYQSIILTPVPDSFLTSLLVFTNVDAEEDSQWRLTAKNVEGAQVLGVRKGLVDYDDCYFGTYYDNGEVRFIVDKKNTETVIPDGASFMLFVEPHTAIYEHTLYLGTEDQIPDTVIESIEGVGNVPAYRGLAYIVFKDMYLEDFGNRIPNLTFEIKPVITDLQDIIEDISADAGLLPDDIDASDLSDITVLGYDVEKKSRREQIEPLAGVYTFDGVEQNGVVVFARRTTTSAISIPYSDLGAHESERTEPWRVTVTDEMELPRSVIVQYMSTDFDYQTLTVSSKRQLTQSRNDITINAGMVLTDAQAQELADKKLYEIWINRTTYETVLSSKYADVVPGKVLSVTDADGYLHTCVVTKATYGKPGLNKIEAVAIAGVIYDVAERTVDPSTGGGEGGAATQVYFEFLDLPKLVGDTSATNNVYFAACGQIYQGVNIYSTSDGGASYNLIQKHTPAATMGHTLTELGGGTEYFFDNANTVDVLLQNGTLESRSEIDVLNGFNAAVIGNEVIQFKTAELIDTDIYRLSGLLRGRLGTEDQITEHGINDRFVLLEISTIGKIPSTDWYAEKTYRAGPATASVDDLTYTDIVFANQARIAQPWSVCHVAGSRALSANLIISWKRRTRFDGEWRDLADVPLNETTERYEVDIMDGETVKRTISKVVVITDENITASATATYTEAQQIADFGSAQSSVTVRIYQISETRGRGIVTEAIV